MTQNHSNKYHWSSLGNKKKKNQLISWMLAHKGNKSGIYLAYLNPKVNT